MALLQETFFEFIKFPQALHPQIDESYTLCTKAQSDPHPSSLETVLGPGVNFTICMTSNTCIETAWPYSNCQCKKK